ncbi:MAG: type II secretion system protein [Phycisphaerae bacterium]|nr:type II secretion system protein [Phycisphaerae bacterium]
MRRKCFTLVELLVVIGIIAVLMGVLLPTLNTVKRTATRVVCGSNLSGIGKAVMLYANDHEGDYPVAGCAGVKWSPNGELTEWDNQKNGQWGKCPAGVDVTITTSLYLLIKYEDVTPSQFMCKGDTGVKEFKFSDSTSYPTGVDDITDLWDFGNSTDCGNIWPGQRNSYAYHHPYQNTTTNSSFPLGSYSDPACPILADRNPYFDKNADSYIDGKKGGGGSLEEAPQWLSAKYYDPAKTGNAACHQREGQNVLFNDTHVGFEKTPNIGITKDNIWKCWATAPPPEPVARDKELGLVPFTYSLNGQGAPFSERDAYLVSETNR